MKKLKTQKQFNKKSNLLVESCGGGGGFGGCGRGPTAADMEDARRRKVKQNRNSLIDELEHTCDECYTELAKNAKFCQECGTKVPTNVKWEE